MILGSGRRVINPLEMIIRNTHAEVATVEANRAMLAVVRLATSTKGSGRWLEEIPEEQAATRFNLQKLTQETIPGNALTLQDEVLKRIVP